MEALRRIDDGAYANLVLPALLGRSRLDERDRGFATDLVYGTTRMQRACDWLCERFLARDVEPDVRRALRLGAYQLAFAGTPPHAAVAATVAVAPARARGLVNAVLRRVADAGAPAVWPSEAVRLSYPDWIVDRLTADLGADAAVEALEAMNEPPEVTERADGYVQDLASQWVAAAVGARDGEIVADVCAAPGGKATAMAAAGATVVASDVHANRAGLVADNARRLGASGVHTVVADARRPPLRAASCDRVLVDAPCSGLGVLRRRPDARWRVTADDVADLASLQSELLAAAADLVRPGGTLVYSVCTVTEAETSAVMAAFDVAQAGRFSAAPPAPDPWEAVPGGVRLLPQTAGTDGMFVAIRTRDPDR